MLVTNTRSFNIAGDGKSRPPFLFACHFKCEFVTSPSPLGLTAYKSPGLPLTTYSKPLPKKGTGDPLPLNPLQNQSSFPFDRGRNHAPRIPHLKPTASSFNQNANGVLHPPLGFSTRGVSHIIFPVSKLTAINREGPMESQF